MSTRQRMYVDTVDRCSAWVTVCCRTGRCSGPAIEVVDGSSAKWCSGSVFRRGSPAGGAAAFWALNQSANHLLWHSLLLTLSNRDRCLDASSLLAFRQSIIESISGFGAGRAMCPSAAMSWSNLVSTPGPQTNSTRASGWPLSVMHWLILSSAWPMKELNKWCSAYSPTVFNSWAFCGCRD
jgi:hypothetical protein